MIAKLTGRIDTLGEDYAIIDVSGVGYLIFCSARTLGRLTEGEHASIVVETHVREDHIHLYGFMEEAERDWFKVLTTVQGVGAKVGLAILSALNAEELLHAIAAGDKAALTRPSGVGPKLAARIASELKDKVGGLALGGAGFPGSPVSGVAGGSHTADAVSALVNLGYGASDALRAVSHVAGSLGEGADLESRIRGGWGEMGPRE
nr:Holliday junction branch migration protein RuvA [Alphaproteobacteria bacterium]